MIIFIWQEGPNTLPRLGSPAFLDWGVQDMQAQPGEVLAGQSVCCGGLWYFLQPISCGWTPHPEFCCQEKTKGCPEHLIDLELQDPQLVTFLKLRHPVLCGVGTLPSELLLTFSEPHLGGRGWAAHRLRALLL